MVRVDPFFVLSGFLITGILLDTRTTQNYFRAFHGRRVLRIFPLYYAASTIVLLAAQFTPALDAVIPPRGGSSLIDSDNSHATDIANRIA
jgi:peptidoglycan/LPS O-acetylase OafA/YrhL